MRLTLLAAVDDNWGIGKDGGLPWHVPEDLSHFKRRTMGSVVVMGRRTACSLPMPLTGRKMLTLTRNPRSPDEFQLPELMMHLDSVAGEVFVAGGEEIYRAMLPYCHSAEITRIKGDFGCDTHMVDLENHSEWEFHKTSQLTVNIIIENWRPK